MALVEYGALVTAFRGSIGGMTFQTNRAGQIVRLRPTGKKNFTEKQSESYDVLANLLDLWRGLTASQRTQWNDYADIWTKDDRWGDTRTLSGWNWFFSLNANSLLIGGAGFVTPPTHTVPSLPDVFTVMAFESSLQLYWSSSFSDSDNAMMIYTTPPISRYTTSFRKDLRLTKVVNPGPFSSITITEDWENTHNLSYPPDSTSDRFYIGVACELVYIASGIASAYRLGIGQYPYVSDGIGDMIIGTSFIIT